MSVLDGIKVYLGLGQGPGTSSIVWTDVTTRVLMTEGISISRGRTDEMSAVGTGTMKLVFDNSDGAFTPGAAGSPYPVALRTPIKVSYVSGSETPRFVGFVDEWDTGFRSPVSASALCRISASDRLKTLALHSLVSGVEEAYRAAKVGAYWPLGDAATSVCGQRMPSSPIGDLVPVTYGTGSIEWGAVGPVGASSGAVRLVSPDAGNGAALVANAARSAVAAGSNGVYVEAFVAVESLSGTIFRLESPSGIAFEVILVGGQPRVQYVSTLGATTAATFSQSIADGLWRHVSMHLTTTSVALYVDLEPAVTVAAGTGVSLSRLFIGSGSGGCMAGRVAHAGLSVNQPVTLSGRTMHVASGAGYPGDTPGARIARIAAWAGVPAAAQAIDAGVESSLSPTSMEGVSALAAIEEVAATDGGLVLASRSGVVVYRSRSDRWNRTADASLDASAEQVGVGVSVILDDATLCNDITVRSAVGVARAEDAASIAAWGRVSRTLDLASSSWSVASDRAASELAASKSPTPRIEGVTVDILTDASVRAVALMLDVSSLVTLTSLPPQLGAASRPVWVEGVTESISASGWDLALSTSMASTAAAWKLGVVGRSELGATTRLAW